MPDFRPPGVFVDELSFRSRTMQPAGTSVTAFVGPTHARGQTRTDRIFTSLADFQAVHGDGAPLGRGQGSQPHYLWHAARAFFDNGGRRLYVSATASGPVPTAVDYEGAFHRLEAVAGVSLVVAPALGARSGQTSSRDTAGRYAALLHHLDTTAYRFAIVDPPDGQALADVLAFRAGLHASSAALYYPWVTAPDPATGGTIAVPPGGFIAGLYARVDLSRGVHKAAANEPVLSATGLERTLGTLEVERLNPAGVNCLRLLNGRVVVWGARTLADDAQWRYVNVRRLILMLERSIAEGLQWAVFEPSDDRLWLAVRESVGTFLTTVWRTGALLGTTPTEAFFVRCDRTTMTQTDIDDGRLICEVGVAPLKPAEFVIFRIGQKTLAAP